MKFLCWKFSIPQKKILIFIKYFLKIKSSLNHHIINNNNNNNNYYYYYIYPYVFSKHTIPHHQKNNSLEN